MLAAFVYGPETRLSVMVTVADVGVFSPPGGHEAEKDMERRMGNEG